MGPGKFSTKGNLGHFTPYTATDTSQEPAQTLGRYVITSYPSTLGKSSLKRRRTGDEDSASSEENSPIKRNRAIVQEENLTKHVSLENVWAKMNSLHAHGPSHRTLAPKSGEFESGNLSQSLSTLSVHKRLENSPIPPDPPPLTTLSIASQEAVDLRPATFQPINRPPQRTSVEHPSNDEISSVNSESLSSKKLYINEMHKAGFSSEDIQKAFKNIHNVDLTTESIQCIIEEYNKGLADADTARQSTHRVQSRSSSTTTSPIPGTAQFKHELPTRWSLSHKESALVASTSNLFIPLDDLAPGEALKALEALQSSLPGKIQQLRQRVREDAERERIRKEEDELAEKHAAEIQRGLDALYKVKRGDTLDLLKREIERKRVG